jgi:hypothetical protein
MSIARLALRLATVQALKGCTLAGAHVRDSEQGPLDEQAAPVQPAIVVFTDDGTRRDTKHPRELFGGDGTQTLIIEIMVTQRTETPDADGVLEVAWSMPATDAGMEIAIDLIERQIAVALSDPDNAWAEMWRQLVMEIGERQSVRGSAGRDGMRFSGRQLNWPVHLPRDPEPGQAPAPLWADFVALMRSTPDLQQHADVVEAAIRGLPTLDADGQIRASWLISEPEARQLGMGPPTMDALTP